MPALRLRDDVPFSGTVIDYMGPLYCKNICKQDDQMFKCWVVLYTCASTRGVVLDLVHNNQSKVFVNSLSRFISRRGCRVTVLSDNGKTFIAEDTQSFAKCSQYRMELQRRVRTVVRRFLGKTSAIRQKMPKEDCWEEPIIIRRVTNSFTRDRTNFERSSVVFII